MLKKLILLLGLCLCVTTSAFAAECPFSDIPSDSPYYQEVVWAYREGIVKGRANGRFDADSPISARELVVMLGRAVDKEEKASTPVEYLELLVERDVFLGVDTDFISTQKLTREKASKIIFKTFGVDIYGEDFCYYEDGPDTFVVSSAIEYGFLDKDAGLYSLMTRGEAVRMMYELSKYSDSENMPEIVAAFENSFDKAGKESNLMRYYLELERVPKVIRDAFVKKGWTLSLNADYLDNYNKANKVITVGRTQYGEKTIYAAAPGVIVHEFGHFLSYVTDANTWNEYCEEASKLVAIADVYCAKSFQEFFAEAFRTYLSNDRDKMREQTPKTYQYFIELEARNWGF